MKKIAKGYRKEKICVDELKAKRYKIWKTIRHKFLNIDMFGLFDVVGLSPQGDHLLFIQVKSNRVDKQTRENIRNLKMPLCCKKEIWVWVDRKGWIKERIEDNGKEEITKECKKRRGLPHSQTENQEQNSKTF
jgi:hypothetical protein